MKRRFFLQGGASALALQLNPALATPPSDGFFHWRRPGYEPYDRQGVRYNDALHEFRDLFARDPDVEGEFRRKVEQSRFTPALVIENWQVTRMLFGRNKRVPNVVVDSSDLAAWGGATRHVRMYTVERVTGSEARFYALFYPEVCGNWSLRIGQRVCVLDQLLCDQGCQELRRRQYTS